MSRNLNYTLTDQEQAALEQAITSSPLAEVWQRGDCGYCARKSLTIQA